MFTKAASSKGQDIKYRVFCASLRFPPTGQRNGPRAFVPQPDECVAALNFNMKEFGVIGNFAQMFHGRAGDFSDTEVGVKNMQHV